VRELRSVGDGARVPSRGVSMSFGFNCSLPQYTATKATARQPIGSEET
jgi:hypothetical protein